LDREDVAIQDVLITALPQLHIIYLITGAAPEPVAVHYTRNPNGAWQGNRLQLPPAGNLSALVALLHAPQGPVLYLAYEQRERIRLYSLPLFQESPVELLSAPAPVNDLQVFSDGEGALHTGYISQGQVFADGYPLSPPGQSESLCLYLSDGRPACSFRRNGQWESYALSPQGWQILPLAPMGNGAPMLRLTSMMREWIPPESAPSAAAPHLPSASPAAPPPADGGTAAMNTSLNQVIRNQAMLLSSLQQSVREMSQQVFALNAQVKALNLQCQGIPTLKDRCTHLENALAAMEEMIAPH
jgi:hypothetical protein